MYEEVRAMVRGCASTLSEKERIAAFDKAIKDLASDVGLRVDVLVVRVV